MISIMNTTKTIIFMPFIIISGIIVFIIIVIFSPIILFFNIIGAPFSKKRINNLKKELVEEWLPKDKYLYIGYTDDFALTDYIRNDIINKYQENIVWDNWSTSNQKWTNSEPDNIKRVKTFWQDICSEYDGASILIIATYGIDKGLVSITDNSFYNHFNKDGTLCVTYRGNEISVLEAKTEIKRIVKESLYYWSKRATKS